MRIDWILHTKLSQNKTKKYFYKIGCLLLCTWDPGVYYIVYIIGYYIDVSTCLTLHSILNAMNIEIFQKRRRGREAYVPE